MKYRPVENKDEKTYQNCRRCGFPVDLAKMSSCPVCRNPNVTGYKAPRGVKN